MTPYVIHMLGVISIELRDEMIRLSR